MSALSEREEDVGRYYDEVIFDAEVTRLKKVFPVEYAITARHLRRWITDATTVIEVGVGGGLYSEMLARRGHLLCLVDVSAKLLDAAVERLRAGGLEEQIVRVERASATNLDCFQDGAFGHAHLTTVDEFRGLFAGAFTEVALVGVEAFSSPWQVNLNELSEAQAEAWLDLIERAETLMPDALGMADHFLYVGEKSHGSLASRGHNEEN